MGILGRFLGTDAKATRNRDEIAKEFEIASCSPSDCESCTHKYPSSLSIDKDMPLWGTVKPWQHHLLVATGKTDWVHDVTGESGTLAHALDANESKWRPDNSRIVISNSSLPPSDEYFEWSGDAAHKPNRLLLLPEFLYLDGITPDSATADMSAVMTAVDKTRKSLETNEKSDVPHPALPASLLSQLTVSSPTRITPAGELAYIFLCSHRTRDKRCAITANILQKAFNERLSELDLYRDASDDRPGGVKVACVSHVGGHKYAANVIIYTKSGNAIWLARIAPEHVNKVLECCVLKGEVFPELLRGAFKTNPVGW